MCASVNSSHLSDEEYDSIKLLDKRVVASALGVSVRTAEGWANGRPGGPECIRVGGCVKWPLTKIRQYIKARLEEQRAARDLRRRRRCKRK